MDIEILLNDKRIYETQQEVVFSSSQLHSTFPRHKKSEDFGRISKNSGSKSGIITDSIIPNLIVPLSKYSSTETENSSSENDYFCGENRLSITLSEFSASATSSTTASRQLRTRRRRKKRKSNGLSASTLSLNSNGSNGSVESRSGCRGLSFLSLNSVKDLEHAIGRHRGVSGSDIPSIDATIFGLFYMTDVFDSLFLPDPTFSRRNSSSSENHLIAADIRALLRKEIVYSLRLNYYCPANKISKLIKMIEEHSPVDKFGIGADISPPTFLKILSGEILNLSPFLSFSNGSNGYVFPLLVEPRLGMSSQQQVHTLQNLLSTEFSAEISGFGKPFRGDRIKFLTVPYPALIIEVIRTQDVTLSPSSSSSSHYRSNNHEPVIPNLELNISPFIAPVGGKPQANIIRADTPTPSFYTSCNSIANASFMSSASFTNSEGSFLYEYDREDPIPKESRLVKGLKSAWKVMFQYLEDFTSSTHVSPDSIVDNGSSSTTATTTDASRNIMPNDNYDDSSGQLWFNEANSSYIHHQPWYINTTEGRTSRSSSVSLGKPRFHSSSVTLASSSLSSRQASTPTPTPQIPIGMELIGVICKSNGKSGGGRNGKRFLPSYSVYCKAGKDTQIGAGEGEETRLFAPWVLFEPQKGVAPQVSLIENCGKWLSFLEQNAENLVLSNVPLEIRRMVTESSLFIYHKID
ncbi:unnamed protein product [Orchesella dallaii]|uniref:Uncharacterized protein n=1 Tax=Orchesella dallaii TaxID=48710 RepID=A0ABP1QIF6_9HEXA